MSAPLGAGSRRHAVDYVLPIKSESTGSDDELSEYLNSLHPLVNIIVVDGSRPDVFDARSARWRHVAAHVPPAEEFQFGNGKVNGVLTGLRVATADKVIIADDDVRYDANAIDRTVRLLDSFDLVIPQNYFHPTPWHAQWDTARSLLNRLTPGGDFPGTLALTRQQWLVDDGYDGDVLFENLELIRTVQARGGAVKVARDLYVARRPPHSRHFAHQRIRQAYDSQAQPARLAGELALLPTVIAARHRPLLLAAATTTSLVAAELGRRRANGRAVFPATATLWAPLWVVERALCSWLALGARIAFGGVMYSGNRVTRAAHSVPDLRRTGRRLPAHTRQPGTDQLMSAITERRYRRLAAPAQRNSRTAVLNRSPIDMHQRE